METRCPPDFGVSIAAIRSSNRGGRKGPKWLDGPRIRESPAPETGARYMGGAQVPGTRQAPGPRGRKFPAPGPRRPSGTRRRRPRYRAPGGGPMDIFGHGGLLMGIND